MTVGGGWWEGTFLQEKVAEKEYSKYSKNRWKGVVHQEKGAVV